MTDTVLTIPAGRIVSNYAPTTLLNNTVATRDVTVPAGRRWFLFAGYQLNADSVARNCTVYLYDAGGNLLCMLISTAALAAAGWHQFPTTVAASTNLKFCTLPLLAGWYVRFLWAAGGASAGGTASSTLIVLEVPA